MFLHVLSKIGPFKNNHNSIFKYSNWFWKNENVILAMIIHPKKQ